MARLEFLVDFLTHRHRHQALGGLGIDPDELAQRIEESGLRFYSELGREVLRKACRLASVDSTALLFGETGVGKTRVAHLIHELSSRREHPFIVVNCGSLPESLIDSELFGHERGSFTGADRHHKGKVSQAGRGTLFIDEIDSLPLAAQAKLLRVVEEREFESVGGEKTEQFKARLIVATNRDLQAEVAAGRFRSDLYFRLNVLALRVPPLRERPEDIPALIVLFRDQLRARGVQRVVEFSSEAVELLQRWTWPGNVRELRNLVERYSVFSDGAVVSAADLAHDLQHENGEPACPTRVVRPQGDLAVARWEAERDVLKNTLAQCGNNRSKAALMLGISRAALYKKLRQFDLL